MIIGVSSQIIKMMAYTTEILVPNAVTNHLTITSVTDFSACDKIITQHEKSQVYTQVLESLIKNGVMVHTLVQSNGWVESNHIGWYESTRFTWIELEFLKNPNQFQRVKAYKCFQTDSLSCECK